MTPCSMIRGLLLEAEPAELRGVGDTEVAEHVRECAACARLATLVLEETERLEAHLAAPGPAAEGVVEAALRRAGGRTSPAPRLGLSGRPAAWVPLAAAAAVAALLFAPDRTPPVHEAPVRRSETPPVVSPAPDQNVAIIATGNPDITVLWIF